MKTIHPAVAQHAMEENEKLRQLLREARDYLEPTHDAFMRAEKHEESSYVAGANLHDAIDAALSRQAEPGDEPAPAQDELWAVHAQGPDELCAAFSREDAEQHAAALNALSMPAGIQVSAIVVASPWPAAEHWKYLAEQERDNSAELKSTTRPAKTTQTEQQEERWQVRYLPGQKVEERWWQDSTAERAAWCAEANAEQLAKGLPDVWEIRKFYAAPIAQTAPRPTGLSKGWNLVRQCDGFVIGHSSEEPSQRHKEQALADGRIYVPFLVAQTAPQPEQSGLVEAAKAFADAARKNIYPCPDKPNSLSGKLQNLDRAIAATLSTKGTNP